MDVGADRLHPRPERRRPPALVAPAPENLGPAELGVRDQLLGGARFPDARFPDQQEQPATAGEGVLEAGPELVHLALAADKCPTRQPVERVQLLPNGGRRSRRLRPGDRRQRLSHRRRALGALLGHLGEEPQDQRLERPRDLDMLGNDRHGVVPEERRAPGQHLVEHGAERVEVAAPVRCPTEGLLGRHVRDRPHHHALHRQARAAQREREPEIAELGGAVLSQPDVRGLEIAVDDAAGVRVL